ncbi:hypothetical protein GWI33_008663, partial [Rhynchophorus ferrugineus]
MRVNFKVNAAAAAGNSGDVACEFIDEEE